jgi:phytoene/squalene synthetase
VLLVGGQLVLGILIRHAGAAARPLAGSWLFYLHVLTAAAILAASATMSSNAQRSEGRGYLTRQARLLFGLVIGQILLGVGSWIATEANSAGRSATAIESWLPTLHVVTGAAVLATTLTLALHALVRRASLSATVARPAEAR